MARENETKFFYIEMKIRLRKLGQSRQKDLNIHGKKKEIINSKKKISIVISYLLKLISRYCL